jgi:hypothetical protein
MDLPFTPDQFFAVLAEYNGRFWPVVAAWWLETLALLVLAWRQPEPWSRILALFLGAMWLWNAVAYHALLFTRINPAAWLFAAMFAVQGALLLWEGWRGRLVFFSSPGRLQAVGAALSAYALVYPFLTIAFGHAYPATPTFGLPCPTVILTAGLLLTVPGGVPLTLAPIAVAWGFIGGSAAMVLGVETDYVLLASGMLLVGVVVAQRGVAAVGRT